MYIVPRMADAKCITAAYYNITVTRDSSQVAKREIKCALDHQFIEPIPTASSYWPPKHNKHLAMS